ncbi:hypothetical protein BGZ98_004661 [Dissophora globulifera]|nr:hypothetical protein BGZ98_004661 [Dissophora globulifera]
MPVSSGELGDAARDGKETISESASSTQDPHQHQLQPKPANFSPPPASSQSYPAPIIPSNQPQPQLPQQQLQQEQGQELQHLQAGAILPGAAFSDEHYEQYDSDLDAELDLVPSRETLHEGQILKSGCLLKKGERIKIWKKKWFVLRTSKLAYYKDSKEYVLLRIIDIRDIHKAAEVPVKNRTGVFVILTPRRTFTVQAESVTEMEEWIEAINQAKVQYESMSSSDIDSSYSGSVQQLEFPPSHSAPASTSLATSMTMAVPTSPGVPRKPELVKQGSGTLLPPRRQNYNPMSLSDQGLLANAASGEAVAADGAFRIQNRNLSPTSASASGSTSPASRYPDSNTLSGLSLDVMSQPTGQMPLTINGKGATSAPFATAVSGAGTVAVGNRRYLQINNGTGDSNGVANGKLSLVTSGTQAIRIGSVPTPSSPPRHHQHEDFPSNSFSSNHSFNTSPETPNSPGYGSGADQFGMGEQNVSSEEEDVVDDPSVLEAGRVAAAANAPGAGLVTGEQIESKVVRQGYLLKLGKRSKTWRKKWFVLRGDKLTYYKNTKEYQPLGIIPLSSIIDSLQTDPVSKNKQYCLRIVTVKRSFVCCAPDEDTLLRWIDALHVECTRVAKEAKWENNDLDGYGLGTGHTEDDHRVLSDPRALGRTAHLDDINTNYNININNINHAGGALSPRLGDGSALLGSSAQSAGSQLKKALALDSGAAAGSGTLATSPASILALETQAGNSNHPQHSVTFQTPPARPFHDEGAVRPSTVTFSV